MTHRYVELKMKKSYQFRLRFWR